MTTIAINIAEASVFRDTKAALHKTEWFTVIAESPSHLFTKAAN